ncbi:TylF/MycF/NovP-related O-methyltransferase [Bradyrhizobium canariense]|uniref:O-methyltransferase n=1 Tax=Bradyrhizobium canariense TaxID=255045 RepID=A0A1H1PLD7_9BRAD|nr:TylF/MycF/NovP-related O-methyltransferase [Bradyrhizobium canariense]SDS11569.1 O-methyltransferase [Bradyrhizobium canariense]
MDNFFITKDFDWQIRRSSHLDRALNLVAKPFGFRANTAHFVDELIHHLSGLSFASTRSGVSTNVEQRMNMYHLVSQTIAYDIDGDLVEVGCNEGQSAVLIAKIIRSFNSEKKLHVYDSFEGLPATRTEDGESYRKGDLATSEDVLRNNFRIHGLELPTIHKGWFDQTLSEGLPEKVCFAHLDGDLYESIMVSLEYVYPRLTPGAICLIDDYCDTSINPNGWNHLPGVKEACDEFLAEKPEQICYLYSGAFTHGFFRKK